MAAEIHDEAGDETIADSQCQRYTDALLHTIHLMGTHVLTDEGRHRCGNRVERTEHELLHLRAGREARYIDGTETVVCRLHDHRADGGDGILEAHRHAHDDEIAGDGVVPAAVCALRMQHRHATDDVDETGDAAQSLRCNRRKCGTGTAEMQYGDAEKVEKYIQKGRNRKEDKRCLRVSDCTKKTRQQVVQQGERDAEENNQQILICISIDIRRCLHDMHDERT